MQKKNKLTTFISFGNLSKVHAWYITKKAKMQYSGFLFSIYMQCNHLAAMMSHANSIIHYLVIHDLFFCFLPCCLYSLPEA